MVVKYILVTGTSRPWDAVASRAARMVGTTLADFGFGLITGNAPGVDKATAESFCSQIALRGGDIEQRYTQLALPFLRRGSLLPVTGYRARGCTETLASTHEWLNVAAQRCAAVVMVGGHSGRVRGTLAGRGALGIVNRFIELGKPVFPIPFSGGRSDDVFQDVLSRWAENPVPQLSRAQFLRLAQPWTGGAGQLGEMLLGALAENPDIFISYRRSDTAWASGRLHRDLSEYFGSKRVFVDVDDIATGARWEDTIDTALEHVRVGLVVIGEHWLEADQTTARPRLDSADDKLRLEIKTLLRDGKVVIPVLANVVEPRWQELPVELRALGSRQTIRITNAAWDASVQEIIGSIRQAMIGARQNPQTPPEMRASPRNG